MAELKSMTYLSRMSSQVFSITVHLVLYNAFFQFLFWFVEQAWLEQISKVSPLTFRVLSKSTIDSRRKHVLLTWNENERDQFSEVGTQRQEKVIEISEKLYISLYSVLI